MKKTWIGWGICLILFIVASWVNFHFFRVQNILAIEFARTTVDMHNCIAAIAGTLAESYRILYLNTLVDYFYLVAYTLLIVFSFRITFDAFDIADNTLLYVLAVIPGVFDSIENIFLLQTALQQKEVLSWVYIWAVRIKWGAAIFPFMLVPVVMIYGLVLALRKRQVA